MLKDFEIYNMHYKVDEFGNIFGKDNILLKQRINIDGYPEITVGSKYVKRTSKRIHRLVAEAFVPNPKNKPEVNHIDGNKLNNHYKNLEWVNRKEQINHAFRMGLMHGLKGENNGRAILSEKKVIKIRELFKQGYNVMQLSKKFNVGWTTISHIVKNETWKGI